MQCRDICAMLSAYIDGMLESPQVTQVEDHLAICESCKLEYDNLLATVELVRGLPEVAPPPEFHANLRQNLQVLPVPTVGDDQTGWLSRLVRGKWFKTIAAAAVLFLAVGVTALWYDKNEGGLFNIALNQSDGQLMADREEQYAGGATDNERATKSNSKSTQELATDTMKEVATTNNAARDTDRGDVAAPGTPASESPRAALKEPEEQPMSVMDDGDTGAAPEGGQVDRDLAVQEGQPENAEPKFFTTAAPEDAAIRAGNNNLQAVSNVAKEITATVTSTDRQDTLGYWSETAGRYDGFVEANPQQTGQYWVLRIPTGNLDGFIKDLNNMGQVDIKSKTKDLVADVYQTEEQLNVLLEREKTLVEQQGAVQTENGTAELDALREQIARQQRVLLDLQEDIKFATINLYIK